MKEIEEWGKQVGSFLVERHYRKGIVGNSWRPALPVCQTMQGSQQKWQRSRKVGKASGTFG